MAAIIIPTTTFTAPPTPDLTSISSYIDLKSNQLTGTISTKIGAMSNMINYIDFSGNDLTGTLPSQVSI